MKRSWADITGVPWLILMINDRTVDKVAQEAHDQIFTFSYARVYLWSKSFFSSKFSAEGVGAMPYLD